MIASKEIARESLTDKVFNDAEFVTQLDGSGVFRAILRLQNGRLLMIDSSPVFVLVRNKKAVRVTDYERVPTNDL